MQQKIIKELLVQPNIDIENEMNERIQFLKDYVKKTGAKGYVLGISGGQDSTLAGKLAQIAMEQLREETGEEYTFIAVRLPYGEQKDEEDAQLALKFINPDLSLTVNIKAAVDASVQSFSDATDKELSHFLKGNTKARERMKVQYDIAGAFHCLVIGTDHAAEAITGFFTKHGDGACDIVPLFGLNKRQGRALLKHLGADKRLYSKVPTADLEDDKPLIPDETALGVTYEEIDDYLEGKEISSSSKDKIEKRFIQTMHKRNHPASVHDTWWK
ncbi:ammonia-dependent NAD(+) synthetase [Fictibacillus phosphorivorans]|uniref:ammonia-dependent NAD(+) synthetase n=1 Tax=Fictibacillus phosphorivorans TaxID=1221500 RepID=UPI00204176D6|nr:ammonia-dependent NAD(+) synthetase [Fictibacillus phosphorivorans]MCM3719299.1 ammonia-dependent NAD(+) synthetase [Fictibacillus phosphorivorans]MCM3776921.1 ammonia-dependent NAD(+) synthetase [Fictibacillus phosphorivorans]